MSSFPSDTALEISNTAGCYIKHSEGKGRGVYGKKCLRGRLSLIKIRLTASRVIQAYSTIEISPILFFTKEEYDAHGKYTILDHYTFKCRDGRMALALGLGALLFSSCLSKRVINLSSRITKVPYSITQMHPTCRTPLIRALIPSGTRLHG